MEDDPECDYEITPIQECSAYFRYTREKEVRNIDYKNAASKLGITEKEARELANLKAYSHTTVNLAVKTIYP